MTKSMTALAAVLVLLSGVAQADTVKQNWNEALGEGNPGRVGSADECIRDSSTGTACYNDREFDAPEPAAPAEVPPNGDESPNGDITTDTLIEL